MAYKVFNFVYVFFLHVSFHSYLLLVGFRVHLMHTEIISIPELFEGSIGTLLGHVP